MENVTIDMVVSLTLIKTLIKQDSTRAALKLKLEDFLTFLDFSSSPTALKILGGKEKLEPPSFTFDERQELHGLLRDQFQREIERIDEKQSKKGKDVPVSDQMVLDAREELHSTISTYADNLIKFNKMLEDLKTLRVETLPEVCSSKLVQTTQQYQLFKSKFTILNYMTQVQIFKENGESLAAYQELFAEIPKMQAKYEKEIEDLRDLKAKYDLVDCEEYREVLKQYLHYTNAIERQKKFEEAIKNP